jgi:hypothetical protein
MNDELGRSVDYELAWTGKSARDAMALAEWLPNNRLERPGSAGRSS